MPKFDQIARQVKTEILAGRHGGAGRPVHDGPGAGRAVRRRADDRPEGREATEGRRSADRAIPTSPAKISPAVALAGDGRTRRLAADDSGWW